VSVAATPRTVDKPPAYRPTVQDSELILSAFIIYIIFYSVDNYYIHDYVRLSFVVRQVYPPELRLDNTTMSWRLDSIMTI
jgi:hypothetical protein